MKTNYIEKYMELVKSIQEYESDTFSATASKLTKKEANHIANLLVCHAIQDLIDTDTMDGVRLSEELEDLRE